MNKNFIKHVLNLEPAFSVYDHYFFEQPVEHIISGFLCEKGSGVGYIWLFVYPLYDISNQLHLGYGYRLDYPNGCIDLKDMGMKDLALEFIGRIEPYRNKARNLRIVDNFIKYLEESDSCLQNPLLRVSYAQSLILVGKQEEAMNELNYLSDIPNMEVYKEYYDSVIKLKEKLLLGLGVAQEYVSERASLRREMIVRGSKCRIKGIKGSEYLK